MGLVFVLVECGQGPKNVIKHPFTFCCLDVVWVYFFILSHPVFVLCAWLLQITVSFFVSPQVLPAVLLDPLGASACLFILGFILSPHVGQHETMSDVMIQRFGNTVGGLAAILSLVGSMLWAGAQYKAIISLTLSLQIFPPEFLEPLVALGLLAWSALGGLVADLWLDALSMLVVAPTMIALATMAWRQTSAEAFQAEQVWWNFQRYSRCIVV